MSQANRRHPLLGSGPLVVLVAGLALAVWFAMPAQQSRKAQLAGVRTWTYQLQDFARSQKRVATSDSDMLVIDYAADRGDGLKPLSRETVEHLKRKPDGSRRLVITYFSVGEAEDYRPYWKASWRAAAPDWIISENCRWPKNYLVKFWEKGWRDIVFGGAHAYLTAIQDAGFDGVYLDRVDVYADIAGRFPQARARMIDFVRDLAAAARARDPGFLVIVQNAEELLADSAYRATIDAVAKEDLLYGVDGTGKRNPPAMVTDTVALLDTLKAEGKPIFAVEYLTSRQAIAAARRALKARGYVGVFPTRALDGADPVAAHDVAVAAATPAEPETGTPEYAQAKCDGVWQKASQTTEPDLPGAASAVH